MKQAFLSATLLFCALFFTAQESYTLKMQVRMEGLPKEYAAYGEQEITTYIKGKKSKTEVNSMMYNSTVYYDGEKITALNDMMGNKQGYTATKAELEAMDTGEKSEKPTIQYTDEKKMIAGYECTKAIITSVNPKNETMTIVVWVTDKINADRTPSRTSRSMGDLGDLKGQPLEMEMSQKTNGEDVKVIMTTSEVLTSDINDSEFVANTEGYKMMTYQEWQEQMKAMGAK